MKFGVNYVPPRQWFYSWQDVNLDYVKEDFEAIKSLGVDHIRLHLRWDLFQPNPVYVPDVLLKKLEAMLNIALENELDVYISVFTGWMSGFWFLPSYTYGKNIISDDSMIEAESYLLKVLSAYLMECPSFKGIDLGNELNVYGMWHPFSIQEGDRWLKYFTEYCATLFPGKEVVLGVDHQPWFEDKYFSRGVLANTGTMTSLHTWIRFCGATDFGIDSNEVLSLQEFNIELANAYATNLNRKVWLQEFGVVSQWMDESKFRDFIYKSMLNATRSDNLWGFTWWCSHEFSKDYKMFDPSEFEFGLLTKENKLKPLGQHFKDCILDIKNGLRPKQLSKGVAIVIDEQRPFKGWDYGRKYSELIDCGIHAKFILSSKIYDEEYLKERSISELIKLS